MSTKFEEKLLALADAGKKEEAFQFWAEKTPERVCRYIRLGNSYDAMVIDRLYCNQLYFNTVNQFDDPREFRYFSYEITSSTSEAIARDTIRRQLLGNLICCFCGGNQDEDRMQEEYMNHGNGIKLIFKVLEKRAVSKVCYLTEEQIQTHNIKEMRGSPEGQDICRKRNEIIREACYRTKAVKPWKHQDEYRIVLSFEDAPFFLQNAYANEHYRYIGDILRLEKIVIGENVSEENLLRLERLAGHLGIQCSRKRTDKRASC